MPLIASTRAPIAGVRRWLGRWLKGALGVVLSVLLAAVVAFGWGAAPLAAATVAAEGPEVRVVGRLPLQLSAAEQREFEQKTLELAAITRRQDHVTSYSCNGDIEHPGVYVFDEIWPSEAALQAHLETPHFKAWWSWVEPHLAGDLVIGVSPTEAFHVLGA